MEKYNNLELSTQLLIEDALKRGLEVEVIDDTENFIRIASEDKEEYIKEATKTRLDTYITFLVMENKKVTKQILEKNKIRVAKGGDYTSVEDGLKDYHLYKDSKIVVKPNSTNFGIGINILTPPISKKDYEVAFKRALEEDRRVLVEEFLNGKEYRFLVIGDEVIGALYRRPASVVGDGKSSIKELVEEKNKDERRGSGYNKPLEKIRLKRVEIEFLKDQNLNIDSVVEDGKRVFLRENSNISTGGDSVDVTDQMAKGYLDMAVEASKSVGAKICGVDFMIEDIENYDESRCGIIELNFNPALHIHAYPFVGKSRRGSEKVLDELGF